MKKIILTFISAGIFTSCAFYNPQYKAPTTNNPSATRNGTKFESGLKVDLSREEWWGKFQDPVLNKLIIDALANNNQIQMAYGNIMTAKARLKQAEYTWLPTLSATGGGFVGNTWNMTTSPQSPQMGQLIPNGSVGNINFDGYYGGFVPSYTFNVFSNINQSKLAKANLEYQKAQSYAIKLSVISQVSGAYFMLLGSKKQLELEYTLINDLKAMQEIEAIKEKNGKSYNANIALYNEQIYASMAKVRSIEDSIENIENALSVLLNKNPGRIKTELDFEQIKSSGIIPANLPSSVLKNRPDMIMAEANLKMANANLGLADSIFFPTISLTGLVGGASLALSNLFSLGTGFWALQAALSMPILNAKVYEEIKAAKGGYYVAYYNYMQTVKSIFADVDNSLTKVTKVSEQYQDLNQAYQSANQFYQAYLVKYQVGHINKQSLLATKLNLDYAKLNLNQTKMSQLDSIVKAYQSLAGGYNVVTALNQQDKHQN